MEEQAQTEEQVFYSQGGKQVPPRVKFEYRNIMHVGDIGEALDALVARTVEKYRRIDAGLDPITGLPRPQKTAAAYLSPRDSAGSASELIAQIAALNEQVAALKNPPKQDPEMDDLKTERDRLVAEIERMTGLADGPVKRRSTQQGAASRRRSKSWRTRMNLPPLPERGHARIVTRSSSRGICTSQGVRSARTSNHSLCQVGGCFRAGVCEPPS